MGSGLAKRNQLIENGRITRLREKQGLLRVIDGRKGLMNGIDEVVGGQARNLCRLLLFHSLICGLQFN